MRKIVLSGGGIFLASFIAYAATVGLQRGMFDPLSSLFFALAATGLGGIAAACFKHIAYTSALGNSNAETLRKGIESDFRLLEERFQADHASKRAQLDRDQRSLEERTQAVDSKISAVAERFISEVHKNIMGHVSSRNLTMSRKKLVSAFEFLEKHGMPLPNKEQKKMQDELTETFEAAVRKEAAKEEQARIRAQIREEEHLEAERQHELQHLENQQTAIETALQKALRRAKDERDEEVERLREQLTEAQAKLQRAKSQAELTKAGFVYVLSNIGSFGENVFKIGMTRRLEPEERVRELSDASVPFAFDVHMMISSENAPSLETALHQAFDDVRLNRVNFRKEFFKTTLEQIVGIVNKHHGSIDYVAEPEALEYRNSTDVSDEDYALMTKALKGKETDAE